MNKTLQDLKVEIESVKKTPTQVIREMKNLGTLTGTSEVNLTSRIQKMEERILGIENTTKAMDTSIK